MFRKLTRIIRGDIGFAYVGGTNTVSSILAGAFWLYFASIAIPENYGQISYLVSSSVLAFTLSSLGMSQTVMTFLPKGNVSVFHQASTIVLLTSLVASIAVGLILNNFVPTFFVLSLIFYSMSTTKLLATSSHKEYAVVSLGNKVLQIVLSLALYFSFGVNGFILGYALANFIFGYRYILGLRNLTFKFQSLRECWKFSAHMYLSNVSSDMRFHWDKVMIGTIFGYSLLASYHFSFQFYSFLSIMTGSFIQYLLPYETAGIIKRNFKFVAIILASSIVVVTIVLTPYLIPILYPQYVDAIFAIQIVSLAIIPQALANLIIVSIMAENKRTHHLLIANVSSNLVYLALAISMGTILSLIGFAISLLIASLIQFLYMIVMTKGKII